MAAASPQQPEARETAAEEEEAEPGATTVATFACYVHHVPCVSSCCSSLSKHCCQIPTLSQQSQYMTKLRSLLLCTL